SSYVPNFGDQIKLEAKYNTTPDLFNASINKFVNIQTGDIVQVVSGSPADDGLDVGLWRYTGTTPSNPIDLLAQHYDTAGNWTQVKGTPDVIYQFMGASNGGKTLGEFNDYTDLNYWKEDAAFQLTPNSLNLKPGQSFAIGGAVVFNDVHGGANATITSATVTAQSGDNLVLATDTATIKQPHANSSTPAGTP